MNNVCRNCMAMERERDLARGELGHARYRANMDLSFLRAELAEALDARDRLVADLDNCKQTLGVTLTRAENAEADRDFYASELDASIDASRGAGGEG